MYAMEATDGGVLWSYKTGGFNSTPAVADGTLYFTSFDLHLYAFRLPP